MNRLTLAFAVGASLAFAAELDFSAAAGRIAAGQSTTLNWRIPPEQRVVLLGKGSVAASGELGISPSETTSYTIVAEGPAGFLSKTITVEVAGSRGVDFPSEEEQFRYPLSDEHAVKSKTAFLDSVHRLLQGDLGFSVKNYSLNDGTIVFLTNSSVRADLVDPPESRRLRARRIAYRLEVKDRTDRVASTVQMLIEYQLRAEETWRKEGREDLYRRKGSELLTRLSAIP